MWSAAQWNHLTLGFGATNPIVEMKPRRLVSATSPARSGRDAVLIVCRA